jgi:hypothetical protein
VNLLISLMRRMMRERVTKKKEMVKVRERKGRMVVKEKMELVVKEVVRIICLLHRVWRRRR